MTPALEPIVPSARFEVGGARRRLATLIYAGLCATPVIVFVLTATAPRSMMCCFCGEPEARARATVMKFAHEAYVQWAQENPTRAYPANLGELTEYMNCKDASDPWNSPYVMQRAKRGILVMSAGPDRMFGTADDIRSDDYQEAS